MACRPRLTMKDNFYFSSRYQRLRRKNTDIVFFILVLSGTQKFIARQRNNAQDCSERISG